MLQLLVIVLLTFLAVLTTSALGREESVFAEFHQTMAVRWLIWLFPLTYALPIFWRVGWRLFFPAPLVILLLLPVLALAQRNRKCLEGGGTDRTKRAEQALTRVLNFGTMAIVGSMLPTAVYWLTPPALRRHLGY
jgi:hypothetical protein